MILKSRITRAAALLISCFLAGVCAFRLIELANKADKFYSSENYYSKANVMSNETNEIYRKLWAVGMMYLRNLDDNGKFKGSKELEEQTIETLQKLECMDDNGNLKIEAMEGYEYMVSYGKQSFSNTGKTFDELNGIYSLTRKNDDIDPPDMAYWIYGNSDFNWYETNYGMTYYYLSGEGFALFDFDTDGLESYVDELGATIYYKTDGTTPIPYNALEINGAQNGIDSGMLDRNISGYVNPALEVIDEPEIDYYPDSADYGDGELHFVTGDGLYYYNESLGALYKVAENNFTNVQGKEMALTMAIKPSAEVVNAYNEYREASVRFDEEMVHSAVGLLPFAAVILILTAYVLITGGYSVKEKKYVLSACDKIFLEFPVALAFFIVMCVFMMCDYSIFTDIRAFFGDYYNLQNVPYIYAGAAGVLFGLSVLIVNTVIVRLKCRSFWKTTLIWRICRYIYKGIKKIGKKANEGIIKRDMVRNDKFTRRFIVRTAGVVIWEFIVALLCIDCGAFGFLLFESVMLLILYVYLSVIDLNAIYRLNKHISDMNAGDYTKRTEKKGSPIYTTTEKLNNISAGIQTAVDKQVKSERMKIDLVTNVSHDLKTPLTSIISYIDLLSGEELSPAARDYVTIIEGKSQRLKSMVADVFDLAKATSRTDVQLELIDAVVLTGQVLGDMGDKIETSGREIRTDIQAATAQIKADGKKMYRVFQNLIDNALKYSLDGTRIYLTLKNENGNCVISVKNIASYEMKFNPEEITERFTRGDESRSTEGNGLGLSIAKSYTEACGGQFRITVDGDVFTAVIMIPLQG